MVGPQLVLEVVLESDVRKSQSIQAMRITRCEKSNINVSKTSTKIKSRRICQELLLVIQLCKSNKIK